MAESIVWQGSGTGDWRSRLAYRSVVSELAGHIPVSGSRPLYVGLRQEIVLRAMLLVMTSSIAARRQIARPWVL